jgi:hypothetical protein
MKDKLVDLMQSGKIELVSSHKKLFFPVIERLVKKMRIGVQFDPIKIHDKLIIDGHHRYVASLLADSFIERIPSLRSSAKKEEAWELVELIDEDWYTAARIKYLDELDARELGLTYEELINKIK